MQGDRLASKDPFTPRDGASSSIISQNSVSEALPHLWDSVQSPPPSGV